MNINEIRVPASLYEKAVKRYESIGKWLEREESSLAKYQPKIYPQGSFALGTAINSPARKGEYDIDLVCELSLSNHDVSQKKLKEMVGKEIDAYAKAHGINAKPEEGNRCWTLDYSDSESFHIDILPAIPYGREKTSEYAETSIGITDKKDPCYKGECNDYPQSNPKGYAKWFKERMGTQFQEQAILIQERVDDVPHYKVETTLQIAIQRLKYHRDKMFANDLKNKPVSIIITTLAAHAYDGETNLHTALANISNKMIRFIEARGEIDWIENPTNSTENFADKWQQHPKRKEAFYCWIDKINTKFNKGEKDDYFDNQTHRQKLNYPTNITRGEVEIIAKYKSKNPKKSRIPHFRSFQSNVSLDKECSLRFTVKIKDIPIENNTKLLWQVVNTGEAAKNAGDLRGKFECRLTNKPKEESTLYSGTHCIECFVIKNEECVARSGKFIVKIK